MNDMKECDCSMEEKGLPTVYPVNYKYCPICGKELREVTTEELRERIREHFKVPKEEFGYCKRRCVHYEHHDGGSGMEHLCVNPNIIDEHHACCPGTRMRPTAIELKHARRVHSYWCPDKSGGVIRKV